MHNLRYKALELLRSLAWSQVLSISLRQVFAPILIEEVAGALELSVNGPLRPGKAKTTKPRRYLSEIPGRPP